MAAEIEAFQAGVLAAAPRLAEWMVVNGLTSSMLRQSSSARSCRSTTAARKVASPTSGSAPRTTTRSARSTSHRSRRSRHHGVCSRRVATTDVVPDEARRSNWVSGYRAWLSVRALEVLREMWREGH